MSYTIEHQIQEVGDCQFQVVMTIRSPIDSWTSQPVGLEAHSWREAQGEAMRKVWAMGQALGIDAG